MTSEEVRSYIEKTYGGSVLAAFQPMKTIYLAGGCFWGIQKYMDQFDGIIETVVGYANGYLDDPTYEDVKAQKSGHAETVKIVYDEKIISLEEILKKFLLVIDPTSLNKQGEDEGSSYRSGIYYTDDKDSDIIVQMIQDEQKKYDKRRLVHAPGNGCFFIVPFYNYSESSVLYYI